MVQRILHQIIIKLFKKFKISKRHFAKSITWRCIGTIDTFIFAWLITGDITEGINLSGITTITKLLWFYIHEQLWFKSSMAESNKRHIIKTLSWRLVGSVDTIIFGWFLIGNPLTGLKIGLFETVSKMLLYYGHEKLWYKINFGLDQRIKNKRLTKKKFTKQ